jgi:hypothetical protein
MPGTQFANEGGASLVERDWTLNTKASFFHDVVLVKASFGSSKAPDVPLEALQTCEGRVREARVQGLSALSYSDAGARWSLAGAAGEPCPKPNAVGTASGQLLVRYGSSRSELLVTEEGTGCTVKTLTTDGTIYRADDTECVLNSSGVAALGVTSRHFDSFVLDFSAKTWSYSARFMRDWKDTALQQCQEVSAQFEGDLAALAE